MQDHRLHGSPHAAPLRAWELAVLVLAVGAAALWRPLAPAPAAAPSERGAQAGAFPPAPRSAVLRIHGAEYGPPTATGAALRREIQRLGTRAPRYADEPRRAFATAVDLHKLAQEHLPLASGGDRASQYLIYRALEECRPFLRISPDAAVALNEGMLNGVFEIGSDERHEWQSDYARCQGFAFNDWSAVGDALGSERPNSVVEYGSVWFERALQAGYPPALAELALRPSELPGQERLAAVREALASGEAEAYWTAFALSGELYPGEVSAPTLAWLILACRAGDDCREQARWYRSLVCVQAPGLCLRGESALERYWDAAPAEVREEAYALAGDLPAAVRAQDWDQIPLPDLAARRGAGVFVDFEETEP